MPEAKQPITELTLCIGYEPSGVFTQADIFLRWRQNLTRGHQI